MIKLHGLNKDPGISKALPGFEMIIDLSSLKNMKSPLVNFSSTNFWLLLKSSIQKIIFNTTRTYPSQTKARLIAYLSCTLNHVDVNTLYQAEGKTMWWA